LGQAAGVLEVRRSQRRLRRDRRQALTVVSIRARVMMAMSQLWDICPAGIGSEAQESPKSADLVLPALMGALF
jgi:hypothetical protein